VKGSDPSVRVNGTAGQRISLRLSGAVVVDPQGTNTGGIMLTLT
jgi:hypothetical protein